MILELTYVRLLFLYISDPAPTSFSKGLEQVNKKAPITEPF